MRLEELIKQPESEKLDFKRNLSSLDGVVKDICAFANTSGGVVVIGIDDDGSVVGLDDPQQDEERFDERGLRSAGAAADRSGSPRDDRRQAVDLGVAGVSGRARPCEGQG
jgi:predicted HTH transcriptional regulator